MVRAVSLFSGAGGFCEGARLAGWEVLCSVEGDDHACRTCAANFPEVPLFQGDIRHFLIAKQTGVPDAEELRSKGVDVVYGGPPCQGFSQIGPRDLDDPRNALYICSGIVMRYVRSSRLAGGSCLSGSVRCEGARASQQATQ